MITSNVGHNKYFEEFPQMFDSDGAEGLNFPDGESTPNLIESASEEVHEGQNAENSDGQEAGELSTVGFTLKGSPRRQH